MESDAVLTVILWCLVGLTLGYTWFPALASGMGAARYRTEATEDPTEWGEPGREPDFEYWHNQLVQLGYEPLGTGWMNVNYHGSDWRYHLTLRYYVSRKDQGFAILQKQPAPFDYWGLCLLATCWGDGGLLLTGSAMDEPPGEGDYIVQGTSSTDLATVREMHLATRDRLIKSGKRIERDLRMEPLLAALRLHAGPAARFVSLKLGQTYLAIHFPIHLFLSAPVVFLTQWDHWAIPLVNLVLGLLFLIGEATAQRNAGRLAREQFRQKFSPDAAS